MHIRNVEGKKGIPFYMLEALQEAGEKGETLTQKEIQQKLEAIGLHVSTNTVRDNLRLIQAFFPNVASGDKTSFGHRTGWSFKKTDVFDASQVYFLMALVQSARRISPRERNDLMKTLRKLAPQSEGGTFASIPNTQRGEEARDRTYKFFHNLEIIGEAIECSYYIEFDKGSIDRNGKLCPPEPNTHHYKVAPYRILSRYDSTYLLGICENEEEMRNFTIELMCNVKIAQDQNGKKQSAPKLSELPKYKGFDFNRYLDTHLYGFPHTSAITLRVSKNPVAYKALYSAFGDSVHIFDDDTGKNTVIAEVEADKRAMLYWAMLYADIVEVLEPKALRENMLKALQTAEKTYKKPVAKKA